MLSSRGVSFRINFKTVGASPTKIREFSRSFKELRDAATKATRAVSSKASGSAYDRFVGSKILAMMKRDTASIVQHSKKLNSQLDKMARDRAARSIRYAKQEARAVVQAAERMAMQQKRIAADKANVAILQAKREYNETLRILHNQRKEVEAKAGVRSRPAQSAVVQAMRLKKEELKSQETHLKEKYKTTVEKQGVEAIRAKQKEARVLRSLAEKEEKDAIDAARRQSAVVTSLRKNLTAKTFAEANQKIAKLRQAEQTYVQLVREAKRKEIQATLWKNNEIQLAEQMATAKRRLVAQQGAEQMTRDQARAAKKRATNAIHASKKLTAEILAEAKRRNAKLKQRQEDATEMLMQGIAGVAAAFGAWRLAQQARDAAIYSARVRVLGVVLDQVGHNAHYSTGELRLFESAVKKMGITTEAARYGLTLLARNHLELARGAEIARIAQDSAVIAGINSSEAYERLVVSVQRLDTRMLRRLGILVNLRNEYQRFALATGRVETSLTAHERQQILLNAVLRAGINVAGAYETAMTEAHKRYTSLLRYQQEAQKEWGQQFYAVFKVAVDSWTAFLKSFALWTDESKQTAAAIAAMTIAFVAMTAAVVTLTFAMKAFWRAAGPVGWVVLALEAALSAAAGAVIFYTAAVENARLRQKKWADEVREDTTKLMQLRDVTLEFRALAEVQLDSKFAQDRFNDSISRAIRLLPKYADRLEAARKAGDPAQASAVVQGAAPGIDRNQADVLNEYNNNLHAAAVIYAELAKISEDAAIARVRATVEEGKELGELVHVYESTIDRVGYLNVATADGERRVVAMSEQHVKAVHTQLETLTYFFDKASAGWLTYETMQEYFHSQEMRRLDEKMKALDTADQLALRAMSQIGDARVKAAKSRDLEILADREKFIRKLGDSYVTEEQVLRRSEMHLEQQISSIREKKRKERIEQGLVRLDDSKMPVTAEGKRAETVEEEVLADESKADKFYKNKQELHEMEAKARRNSAMETDDQLQKIANVRKARVAAAVAARIEIEQNALELQQLKEELELRRQGLDVKTAEITTEVRALKLQKQHALKQFERRLEGGGDPEMIREAQEAAESYGVTIRDLSSRQSELSESEQLLLNRAIEGRRARLQEIDVLKHGITKTIEATEADIAHAAAKLKYQVVSSQDVRFWKKVTPVLDKIIENRGKMTQKDRENLESLGVHIELVEELLELYKKLFGLREDQQFTLERIASDENWRLAEFREKLQDLIEDEKELREERKDAADEHLELLGYEIDTLESVRKQLIANEQEMWKNNQAVAEFNRQQAILASDREMPGFKKVQDVLDKYIETVEKAGSVEQLKQTGDTFRMAIAQPVKDTREELIKLQKQYGKLHENWLQRSLRGNVSLRERVSAEESLRELGRKIFEQQKKVLDTENLTNQAREQLQKATAKRQEDLARGREAERIAYENLKTPAQKQAFLEEKRRRELERQQTPVERQIELFKKLPELLQDELTKHDEKVHKLDAQLDRTVALMHTMEAIVGLQAESARLADAIALAGTKHERQRLKEDKKINDAKIANAELVYKQIKALRVAAPVAPAQPAAAAKPVAAAQELPGAQVAAAQPGPAGAVARPRPVVGAGKQVPAPPIRPILDAKKGSKALILDADALAQKKGYRSAAEKSRQKTLEQQKLFRSKLYRGGKVSRATAYQLGQEFKRDMYQQYIASAGRPFAQTPLPGPVTPQLLPAGHAAQGAGGEHAVGVAVGRAASSQQRRDDAILDNMKLMKGYADSMHKAVQAINTALARESQGAEEGLRRSGG